MTSRIGKKLLAASVLAALNGVANAAAPTLGEVLKASAIDITGYVDVSYTYLSTDQGSNTYRAYDTERRSFNLHAVDVAIGYLPASGAGVFVQMDAGSDANVSASTGTGAADEFDVQEAYLQYATGALSIVGGKFATSAGAEVIESPNNTNFSRSLLFRWAIPFTHTGLRVNVTASDTLKFMVGLNNGWDVVKESATANAGADGKTVELGVSATPIKPLTLAASYHRGEEPGTVQTGERSLLDVVATFNLNDAMSFVVNVDQAEQDKATATRGKAKWNGVAGYFNYKLSDAWRLSVRAEQFDDKNGFRTGTTQKLKEATVTLAHTPTKNVEVRAEVRADRSNQTVFTEDGVSKKTQNSAALEAIYKF